MPKKKSFLLMLWGFITLLLCIYLTIVEYDRQNKQEVFVNQIYFLLKDVHQEMAGQTPEDIAESACLHDALVKLDAYCLAQSAGVISQFNYPRRGTFETINRNIQDGAYKQRDVSALARDIELLLQALSDESGRNSNDTIRRKELNDCFASFLQKWNVDGTPIDA